MIDDIEALIGRTLRAAVPMMVMQVHKLFAIAGNAMPSRSNVSAFEWRTQQAAHAPNWFDREPLQIKNESTNVPTILQFSDLFATCKLGLRIKLAPNSQIGQE